MAGTSTGRTWPKRVLFGIGGLAVFLLLFVVAVRITVTEMFRGIESSRATGLSAVTSWDMDSMWSSGGMPVDRAQVGFSGESRIASSADLSTRSSSFDRFVVAFHQIVSAHHGSLESLRTESRSGQGRVLLALLSVPSSAFDAALSDLKALGRIEGLSQAGEDSAVKLAASERHLASAQVNLSRLQKLQRERKGELRDAVALEKDIAQADEALTQAQRQRDALLSTVAQAHIRVILIEDYHAPLEIDLAGVFLKLRNSFVEGLGAIFGSVSLILGVLFEFGLPLIFWLVLLFYPVKLAWRRFYRSPLAVPVAD